MHQSHASAPPFWYSITRVSNKLFSYFRSTASDIAGKPVFCRASPGCSPSCAQRLLDPVVGAGILPPSSLRRLEGALVMAHRDFGRVKRRHRTCGGDNVIARLGRRLFVEKGSGPRSSRWTALWWSPASCPRSLWTGIAQRMQEGRAAEPREKPAAPPGQPARGSFKFAMAGLLAHSWSPLPAFPTHCSVSGMIRQQLATLQLGGQRRNGPCFPFSSRASPTRKSHDDCI